MNLIEETTNEFKSSKDMVALAKEVVVVIQMIQFHSRVKKIEQKKRIKRAWKVGDDVRTEEEDMGWFMLMEGSWEYLYVGDAKPNFDIGDDVTVTIERRTV